MDTTVSSKGWVVIPANIRKKYGIHPGDKVRFIDYGGVITLVPMKENPVKEGLGMLSGGGKRSLVQALLDDHDQELRNERR